MRIFHNAYVHQIDLVDLEKALQSLDQALAQPKNEYTRDATILRVRHSFELMWKTAKKFLGKYGIQSNSPRTTIRDMAQQGWISDAEMWLGFLDNRNLTSHTYKENIAEQVYNSAKQFHVESKKLLSKFKTL